MPCCKCCCEGGTPGGVCCGDDCCKRPGVCCGGTCCPEGEVCCRPTDGGEKCGCDPGGVCCPEGHYCCDGVCQSEPCDPPCDPPCDGCSTCVDGECVSACDEGEQCCDGNCLECCDDPDCPDGQVCVDGSCVEPPPFPCGLCGDFNSVRDCGDYSRTIRSETVCNGAFFQQNEIECDCAGLGVGFITDCSDPIFAGVPPEYGGCGCLLLGSSCTNYAYNTLEDEAGNCISLKFDVVQVNRNAIYVFQTSTCQWIPLSDSILTSRTGCVGFGDAPCPEPPNCTPPVCDETYGSDCECNPLP